MWQWKWISGFMSLVALMAAAYGAEGNSANLSQGNAATSAVAAAPVGDPYVPLYLMYSGDPSPARLQGLRQFLKSHNASDAVYEDTLDTVVYKLKTYKAGFAYPVYFSETEAAGNACVMADGRTVDGRAPAPRAIQAMTTPRLLRYALGERAPELDENAVQDSVFTHELFHCYDLMKQSQADVGSQIARDGAHYFAYWSETGADAYAALIALRNGGDKQLLRRIRDFRTLNLLNGDSAHYTARTLEYILWHFDHAQLATLNARQLVQLAYQVRTRTAYTPQEFHLLVVAANAFEKQFAALTRSDAHPSSDWVQDLIYAEPDPEYFSALIIEVRLALYNLGGDITPANTYVYPIVKKFYLPVQIRSASAY